MNRDVYKAYANGFVGFNFDNQKTMEDAVAFALGIQDRQNNVSLRTFNEVTEIVAKSCDNQVQSVPEGCINRGLNVLVLNKNDSENEVSSTFTRISLVGKPEVIEKLATIIGAHGALNL